MHEVTTLSTPFRNILFAGDFGTPARKAFAVADSLAQTSGARLIVLHVDERTLVGEAGVPVYVPGESVSDTALLLSQLRATYAPGEAAQVEYRVEQGFIDEQILRTAEAAGCDLIVMGTAGRVSLDRLLLGSIAEAVTRRAHCACLTVSPSAEEEHALPAIRTILHPTDFSCHSEAALRVARELARIHGARLVVLHVVANDTLPGAVPEMFVAVDSGRKSLEALRTCVEGPDLAGPVETQLRRGDPSTTVLEKAADLDCDLIVIGSHGRTALGRLLMGSVAESVMRGAPCPVLTVKVPVPASAAKDAIAVPLTAS